MRRYDQDKEPPCPVWCLDPLTPIVPISFLRVSWYHGFEPWCVRSTEFSIQSITSRSSSLVLCDTFPYACTRLPHGRFLLSSGRLPEVSYGEKFCLAEGLLDQYSVSYDDIVDSILQILAGNPEVTLGLSNRSLEASQYVCSLKDIWQAMIVEFAGAPEEHGSDAEDQSEGS